MWTAPHVIAHVLTGNALDSTTVLERIGNCLPRFHVWFVHDGHHNTAAVRPSDVSHWLWLRHGGGGHFTSNCNSPLPFNSGRNVPRTGICSRSGAVILPPYGSWLTPTPCAK